MGGRCKYIPLLACTANVPICPACNYLRGGKLKNKPGVSSDFFFGFFAKKVFAYENRELKSENECIAQLDKTAWLSLQIIPCTGANIFARKAQGWVFICPQWVIYSLLAQRKLTLYPFFYLV